jgi:hypothetical protein
VCLAEFALPTEGPWGPQIGELVVLHKMRRTSKIYHKKKVPRMSVSYEATGAFLIAESAGEWGVNPVAHMVCPCCANSGSMVLDFEDGQQYPKCGEGVLTCSAVEY